MFGPQGRLSPNSSGSKATGSGSDGREAGGNGRGGSTLDFTPTTRTIHTEYLVLVLNIKYLHINSTLGESGRVTSHGQVLSLTTVSEHLQFLSP